MQTVYTRPHFLNLITWPGNEADFNLTAPLSILPAILVLSRRIYSLKVAKCISRSSKKNQ